MTHIIIYCSLLNLPKFQCNISDFMSTYQQLGLHNFDVAEVILKLLDTSILYQINVEW